MSKIAVITGSPRKKGNSFAMTDAFIQAAPGLCRGAERQIFKKPKFLLTY